MTASNIARTPEKIDAEMARVLAAKTPAERLQVAFRMWNTARTVLRAAIVADHADWTADRVDREVALRLSHGLVGHVAR